MLLFKNHFRIILNSKSQNFKNHKAQIKFINSYTKRVSMALNAASGRKERADRSFNYCCSKSRWFWKWLKYDLIFAWLFSYKDSNFWYFSCVCKVKKKCSQKISENIVFSVGISGSRGTLVGNGLNKFHDFHLFVLEATSEISSAKYLFSNCGKEP